MPVSRKTATVKNQHLHDCRVVGDTPAIDAAAHQDGVKLMPNPGSEYECSDGCPVREAQLRKPYWRSECGRAVVYVGDNLAVMGVLEAEQFHAVVTDPPYGLEFMGKAWDAPWKNDGKIETCNEGTDKSHPFRDGTQRVCYGNKRVRKVDNRQHRADELDDPIKAQYLRHNVEYVRDSRKYQEWFEARAQAMIRVAKSGAHLLSFGGTRMWHRMACATEDAGWEIRDTVMWVYGSGFPKSHDVSKSIDKMLGADRTEVLGKGQAALAQGQFNSREIGSGGYGYKEEYNVMSPATDAAKQWQGWGSSLKPSHEPVILARKPFVGTVAHCVMENGTGAINVDACRVGTEEMRVTASDGTIVSQNIAMAAPNTGRLDMGMKTGRWPANLIHDGSDEVVGSLPDGASRYFYSAKADSGDRPHGKGNWLDGYDTILVEFPTKGGALWDRGVEKVQLRADMGTSPPRVIDVSGSQSTGDDVKKWSTFLFGSGSMAQFLKDTNSTTKITTSSTIKSRTLNWLMTSLTSASIPVASCETESGGSHAASVEKCNPSQLVITLGRTASLPGASGVKSGTQLRISSVVAQPVVHPTCKPLDLMRYLVRLVCAPGGTVLDPFMGSGSTGCAALLEGMRFVGIEQSQEYADIAVGRLKLALAERRVEDVAAPPGQTARTSAAGTPPPPRRLRGAE